MVQFLKALLCGVSGLSCVLAPCAAVYNDHVPGPAKFLIFCAGLILVIVSLVHFVKGINALSGDKPVRHLLQAFAFGGSSYFFIASLRSDSYFVKDQDLSVAYVVAFLLAGLGSGVIAVSQLCGTLYALYTLHAPTAPTAKRRSQHKEGGKEGKGSTHCLGMHGDHGEHGEEE